MGGYGDRQQDGDEGKEEAGGGESAATVAGDLVKGATGCLLQERRVDGVAAQMPRGQRLDLQVGRHYEGCRVVGDT